MTAEYRLRPINACLINDGNPLHSNWRDARPETDPEPAGVWWFEEERSAVHTAPAGTSWRAVKQNDLPAWIAFIDALTDRTIGIAQLSRATVDDAVTISYNEECLIVGCEGLRCRKRANHLGDHGCWE